MIAVLGLFPRFLSTAVGTLSNANTKKNVRTKSGLLIPRLTRYGYVYTVGGKQYCYSAESRNSKRRLLRKTVLVFVKWFPRRAYPNKFTGIKEWALGLSFLLVALLAILTM